MPDKATTAAVNTVNGESVEKIPGYAWYALLLLWLGSKKLREENKTA
jgi:hypothetical protein